MFRSTGWMNICGISTSIALIVTILFTAHAVRATESIDGHRFLNLCVVTESDYESERRFATCESFVREIRDLLRYNKVHSYSACIPEDAPDIQLVIAGIARLQSNPAQQNREAHATLAEIFAQRWPCNSKLPIPEG